MLSIETVAVMGAGERGTDVATLAALAGCAVRLHDGSPGALASAVDSLRRGVELAFAQGAITRTERQRIADGVLFTSDLDEALTGADLVVCPGGAASPELCAGMAGALRATAAVAAAGTAADELAAHLPQPGRVLAIRLLAAAGPFPRVEVLPASATTAHALERARAFADRVNRAARLPVTP